MTDRPCTTLPSGAVLRPATPADVEDLLRLVHALAAYEKEPDAVTATAADYRRLLFPSGGDPTAYAEVALVDSRVVGMAMWHVNFSTWTGQSGIWLEDLFVQPEHRGSGLGVALLRRLAAICTARGWTRLEWWVLDWNEPSIGFYRSLGATPMDEWTVFRVDGAALERLGSPAVG